MTMQVISSAPPFKTHNYLDCERSYAKSTRNVKVSMRVKTKGKSVATLQSRPSLKNECQYLVELYNLNLYLINNVEDMVVFLASGFV